MCCGVELHDKLLVPLCELLPNKIFNSTRLEAVIYCWIVSFILLDVVPVDPSHVTHNGLLVKQNGFIEILLLLGVESVVNCCPSPHIIRI